jgi:small-conductance mechanosensitive channel
VEFTQPYWEQLLEQAIIFLPKLFFGIVIFFVAWFFANLAAKAVRRALALRNTDREVSLLLARITRWAIIIWGLFLGLQQVEFNLTGFVTGLGIVGFTIGFAFQDIAKNFMAGMLLLLQQPFDIGDSIEVAGYAGTVTDIEIRSTALRTPDGKHVIIPNAEVFTGVITNFSRSPRRRLQLEVGVAYDSDLEQVTDIIRQTISQIEGVIQDDPAPNVVFNTFGDSAINLTLYYWVDVATLGIFDAQDRVLKAVKLALEEAGVEIPFPTRAVLNKG